MKKTSLVLLFLMIILISADARGRRWGIGVKYGSMAGITIKRYLPYAGYDLSLGRGYHIVGMDYYDAYLLWYEQQGFSYGDHDYLGYKGTPPLGFQFHYIFHKDMRQRLNIRTGDLKWYFGAGVQMMYQSRKYSYRYTEDGTSWTVTSSEAIPNWDLGMVGVLGLEYTVRRTPLSFSLEINPFFELWDESFKVYPQASLGARYRL